MFTKWTSHLQDPKDKSKFESAILGSKSVLERLQTIMKEDLDTLEHFETSTKVFETPNWDYKQAYFNGYKACLKQYQKVIDLDQQEITHGRQSTRPDRATNRS